MLLQLTVLVIISALLIIFAKDLAGFSKELWEKRFFRHLSVMLIIALVITLFAHYAAHSLHLIVIFYFKAVKEFLTIIGPGQIDEVIAKTLLLFLLPVVVCAVPQFLYWLLKGHGIPYFYHMLWACFVLLTAITIFPVV